MRSMARKLDWQWWCGAERRRAAVCVALIAMLLYNPFFTILGSSLYVSVRHPLSYRATVAGAELQRGTAEKMKPLAPAFIAVIFLAMGFDASSRKVEFLHSSDSVVRVVAVACDCIWFRPPPSA